jgi:DNA polymerase III delta prime subunit
MDSKLTEGLFDLMTDMSDTHPLLRAMLYGDSGVGKTVLAAQIAHKLGGRWLYVDYAQGFTTLTINPRWKYLTENMKRMQYQGMSQFEPLRDAINSDDPRFQFNGIILDESSSMADQNLLTVVKGRASKEPTKDENEPQYQHL